MVQSILCVGDHSGQAFGMQTASGGKGILAVWTGALLVQWASVVRGWPLATLI